MALRSNNGGCALEHCRVGKASKRTKEQGLKSQYRNLFGQQPSCVAPSGALSLFFFFFPALTHWATTVSPALRANTWVPSNGPLFPLVYPSETRLTSIFAQLVFIFIAYGCGFFQFFASGLVLLFTDFSGLLVHLGKFSRRFRFGRLFVFHVFKDDTNCAG